MAVSILHRVSGGALTVVGLAVLTWWLSALAAGGDAYAKFEAAAKHPLGVLVLVGLTWAFFQHLASGVRHLVMDTGENFEIRSNKNSALATIIISVLLTAALWAYVLGVVK